MKKNIVLTVAIFMVSIMLLKAQNDPASQAILNGVKSKTSTYTDMKISFDLVVQTKDQGNKNTTNKSSGTIKLKGSKFQLKMPSNLIYCNGTTVWSVMDDAETVQISNYEVKDGEISPANLLTIWEQDFRNKLISEKTENGIIIQTIDLIPLKSRDYFKVQLQIDKTKKQITKAIIYLRNGTTYTYTILTLLPNQNITDAEFTCPIKDYQTKGYDIEDLR